jgi:hypothetical protein
VKEGLKMKKIMLILVGAVPFFVGYGMNYLMLGPFSDMVLPYKLIGIAFLIAWFFIGRYSYKLVGTKKVATILGNSIAFIVLLLTIYQEYVLGQYWTTQIEAATQFYYLPIGKNLQYFLDISRLKCYSGSIL